MSLGKSCMTPLSVPPLPATNRKGTSALPLGISPSQIHMFPLYKLASENSRGKVDVRAFPCHLLKLLSSLFFWLSGDRQHKPWTWLPSGFRTTKNPSKSNLEKKKGSKLEVSCFLNPNCTTKIQ